ncbi:unnamed protein product [Mytilus coruscus]|uniref:Reverse transcriptase domain-containing protein n=1 Tax=Mytilus coruscus TaxID=42192 RepID=A0A6J8DYA9_MYTCO|nr:unnamed protein product [Mytilus coruscus]
MSIKFKYKNAEVNHKTNNSRIKKKVNSDKVDKEWYSAHIDTHIDSLQINENMKELAAEQTILKLCELLRATADLTSSSKETFNAKPKLKVWTPEIQSALKTARKKYKHIIYAGSDTEKLVPLVQCIFKHGSISEPPKLGLLTPVFENKGTRQQTINYRGITVLPVIGKIVETIIKERSTNRVLETQNKKQRGFTAGSSPLNSANRKLQRIKRQQTVQLQSFTPRRRKAAFDTVMDIGD